jgi:hypothetical protein
VAATKRKPRSREPKAYKSELKKPTPWVFEGRCITEFTTPTEDYAGFVYLIENLTNQRRYIGRKYFHAHTRVKVAGRKNRKRKVKESDWRHYKSSCIPLKKDIEELGVDKFRFTILSLHDTRAQCNYEETKQQFLMGVLEVDGFYNEHILSRYYRQREQSKDCDPAKREAKEDEV